jgi:hypothetical protein
MMVGHSASAALLCDFLRSLEQTAVRTQEFLKLTPTTQEAPLPEEAPMTVEVKDEDGSEELDQDQLDGWPLDEDGDQLDGADQLDGSDQLDKSGDSGGQLDNGRDKVAKRGGDNKAAAKQGGDDDKAAEASGSSAQAQPGKEEAGAKQGGAPIKVAAMQGEAHGNKADDPAAEASGRGPDRAHFQFLALEDHSRAAAAPDVSLRVDGPGRDPKATTLSHVHAHAPTGTRDAFSFACTHHATH